MSQNVLSNDTSKWQLRGGPRDIEILHTPEGTVNTGLEYQGENEPRLFWSSQIEELIDHDGRPVQLSSVDVSFIREYIVESLTRNAISFVEDVEIKDELRRALRLPEGPARKHWKKGSPPRR